VTTPLEEAVARIGDRWTLLLIDALLDGPLRFGELSDRVTGIAPNVLTSRLRQLERDGLVTAAAYSARPARYTYELTGPGRDLADALTLLSTWGARQSGRHEGVPHHDACGSAVEVRLWCPTCERLVDEEEAHSDVRL
jgi:DNA-binding HxlR family transcriptional regulator